MTTSRDLAYAAILDHFDSLMRHAARAHTSEFLEVEVTMSQAKVLHLVRVNPDISMSDLASQLRVGLSAISGLVDRLVEHDYLERHEDPSDRRQNLVNVTRLGAQAIDRMRDLSSTRLRSMLDGLSVAELEGLNIGMAALARQAVAQASDDSTRPLLPDPERTAE